MTIMDIWEKMYNAARKVQNARTISSTIEVGSVAARAERL